MKDDYETVPQILLSDTDTAQTQQDSDTTQQTQRRQHQTQTEHIHTTPVISQREVSPLHNLYVRQREMQLNKWINPSICF
jgi:hypothetical protein